MKKVRIGIIGTGNISRFHAQGYNALENAELVAVCDVNRERALQRQSEWGAKKAYTDYHELLADPEVDAVDIITPHHLHREMGLAALAAGKHVSMQKPMVTNMAECRELTEAVQKSGLFFRTFENFQYYPPIVKAKELLDSGAIGEAMTIRMKVTTGYRPGWEVPVERWAWRFDPAKGGGGRIMLDYGSHMFAVAMYFMGPVEKVFSWISHTPFKFDWVIDSPAVVIWKYKNAEKYGTFEVTTSDEMLVRSKSVPEDEWFEITGSKGFIWINRCNSMLLDRPPLEVYRDGVVTSYSDVETDPVSSFMAGCKEFVDAIIEGRPPRLSVEDGSEVIRFCRAAEQSARERREVYLDANVE